jgi:GNAT superfamily N-acetyltransferase
MREAAEWVWVPSDAQDDTTPERRLTLYPHWASVQWSRTDRPFEVLLAETVALAEAAGRPSLRWWTRPGTQPADTPDRLMASGFEPTETLDVLALDLTEPDPPGASADRLAVPPAVQVRPVVDEEGLRVAGRLAAEVFDEPEPTAAQLADEAGTLARFRPGDRWLTRRWLAWLDGRPVGRAGATMLGDLARLWGGAVTEDARGQGVYRALLHARCVAALDARAQAVLVKGRVQTSAPVLRRAGFQVFGRERCFELRLDPRR